MVSYQNGTKDLYFTNWKRQDLLHSLYIMNLWLFEARNKKNISVVKIKCWSLMGVYLMYLLSLFNLHNNLKRFFNIYQHTLHIYYSLRILKYWNLWNKTTKHFHLKRHGLRPKTSIKLISFLWYKKLSPSILAHKIYNQHWEKHNYSI